MKIEEYIKLRKKRDGLDETIKKNKDESIRTLINYIFDYYQLLEEGPNSKKIQIKKLRKNVNFQYEIEFYSENTQRWLLKNFNQHNVKINRQLSKILDDIDFFLLISDMQEWEKLSYDLYTKAIDKRTYLADYPLEILEFAKEYYKKCDKEIGLSLSQYKLSQKSKQFIKTVYSEHGINLLAWSKFYSRYFFSKITLWPDSHRIVSEENGKRKVEYNLNVTRNAFNLNSVFDKISDTDGVASQLKKNRKVLVELLREINSQSQEKS